MAYTSSLLDWLSWGGCVAYVIVDEVERVEVVREDV